MCFHEMLADREVKYKMKKSIRNRVISCNGKIDIVTLPGKDTETTIEPKTENI